MKSVTVQLDPTDYSRLTAEAQRRGVATDVLARSYVRSALDETTGAVVRREGLEALDHLVSLAQGLPSIDAVVVAREGRDDLERRSLLP
jgi:hypothetical protein